MRRCLVPTFALAILGLLAPGTADAATLTKEPGKGALRYGVRVLVDDGACPKGQIKEVTGGKSSRGIKRTRRCIPR